MTIIASFAVMLVFLSGRVDDTREATLGGRAPEVIGTPVALEASEESLEEVAPLDMARREGRRVILSFWSAADAPSRLLQSQVNALLRDHNASNNAQAPTVEAVSVNFDRSERLMKEVIRLDRLDEGSQFRIGNADAGLALREAYRMEQGLRTFLIDEQGRIVAADPSEEELRKFVNRA